MAIFRSNWFPWRQLISWLARSHSFVDPMAVIGRLHRFGQPSEVTEPIELLRAGLIFHARGLLNTRAIQHNLDWVWPYWIEQQFDPASESFLPRAFSVTHVNLTHRNWTAVGLPDLDALPVVDPRGLVTPLYDEWSLDAWVVPRQGEPLLPSRQSQAKQQWLLDPTVAVRTTTQQDGMQLVTEADVQAQGEVAHCRYVARARSQAPAWLVIALRPVNPEGVAFIHRVQTHGEGQAWTVDDQTRVEFDAAPQRVAMSNYKAGDVAHTLPQAEPATALTCDVGMVTAVAMFELTPGQERQVTARVPLRWPNPPLEARVARHSRPLVERASWTQALEGCCHAQLPDRAMTFLFDAALRTLVLHAPGEVYPGPYTYKRFWFRDAAIILESLLQAGMLERVKRALSGFPTRQTITGYFRSQDGEWDSNGQVLWIMHRYRELSGEALPASWIEPIRNGARWIERKRTSDTLDAAHAGLMPAGFSAEHLGPNDYYYWDDFWSAAGLQSAAAILAEAGQTREADLCRQTMAMLMAAVDRSLRMHNAQRDRLGIPASPYRRMDAGAIGSLAASYPLRLWDPADPRMMQTIEFLLRHCMVHGGFFQDVIHSGINAYLTLHMAQVMLRADDERSFGLMEAVAKLASPTGQWPEAIHPRTGGGCMGDGHHVWAAAEWVAMVRNLFVREEGDTLVLCSGLPRQWTQDAGASMSLGPTLTPFGSVSVQARRQGQGLEVAWQAAWRRVPGVLLIKAPGFEPVEADSQALRVVLQPAQSLAAT